MGVNFGSTWMLVLTVMTMETMMVTPTGDGHDDDDGGDDHDDDDGHDNL